MADKFEEYIVRLKRPAGVSVRELTSYIENAVACWCKGGDPDGALFDLDGDKVQCRKPRARK